jgi:putative addiction module component (TIGR02574 family)
MSHAAEQLLEAAMALPDDERAEVVARLQESLGGFANAEIAAEWEAEIADRLKAIDDGSVELIPAEEVHRELRKKYGFFKG